MSNSSEVKLKQNVGEPMMRSSGCVRTASCIFAAVAKIFSAVRRYPSLP